METVGLGKVKPLVIEAADRKNLTRGIVRMPRQNRLATVLMCDFKEFGQNRRDAIDLADPAADGQPMALDFKELYQGKHYVLVLDHVRLKPEFTADCRWPLGVGKTYTAGILVVDETGSYLCVKLEEMIGWANLSTGECSSSLPVRRGLYALKSQVEARTDEDDKWIVLETINGKIVEQI